MSKFKKLTAEIEVAAVTKAQDYNVETRERTDAKTKDGAQKYELHIPVKTKVKKGEVELEELNYEKLNSLIEIQPGNHTVELEMFEIMDKPSKKMQTFFRVIALVKSDAAVVSPSAFKKSV